MQKIISITLILVLLITTLTGCFDALEIDDEVYAICIGVDDGIHNKIRLTIQYPTYTEEGAGSGMSSGESDKNQQGGNIVHSIEAPTILEAIDLYGMSVSRKVSLMHAKYLFFSESVAKKGIFQYVQAFARYSETRPSMAIVIVNGKAEDFILENSVSIGGTISKTMELLYYQSEFFGYFPKVLLHNFEISDTNYMQPIAIYAGINKFKNLEDGNDNNEKSQEKESDYNINQGHKPGELPRKGVAKRELVGTAVFKKDKMVGSLDEYETIYYLVATNKHKAGSYTILDKKDKNRAITFNIRSNGTKVYVNFNDIDRPVINLKIGVEADIKSIQSGYNYEKFDIIDELNESLKENLLEGVNKVIEKTQKEFKADIFGFGKDIVCNFLTIQQWEKYNWESKYPNAKINVDMDVNIRRTGSLISSSKNN